jgi:hypothetical protein
MTDRYRCPDCGQLVAATARIYEVPRPTGRPLTYRYLVMHNRPGAGACRGAYAWLVTGFHDDWKPPRYLRRF